VPSTTRLGLPYPDSSFNAAVWEDIQALADALDALVPSAAQQAALAGTSFTPSGTNKFVTDQDARLGDTRIPTDGSVTTAKLVDGAVTAAKIAADAITAAQIAADAIGSSELAPDSVTAAEIAAGAVGSGELDIIPAVRCGKTLSQSIPTGSIFTPITFNQHDYDQSGMHSTVTNTSRITVPKTGIYHVFANLRLESQGSGWQVNLRKNGPTTTLDYFNPAAYQTQSDPRLTFGQDYLLQAGDYIELYVANFDGATTRLVYGDNGAHFGATYLGRIA
jgi:hypothetical protein